MILAPKMIMTEKDGKMLKAEYFEHEGNSGAKFYIDEQLVAEETYEGKSIHWARDAAENWLAGIKTLNG